MPLTELENPILDSPDLKDSPDLETTVALVVIDPPAVSSHNSPGAGAQSAVAHAAIRRVSSPAPGRLASSAQIERALSRRGQPA